MVLIRERPFYNPKRRSIYINDSQSNYSMSINGSINGLGTINNNYSSLASRQTIITNTTNSIVNNNNRSTLTSSTTMDWTNNQTNDF